MTNQELAESYCKTIIRHITAGDLLSARGCAQIVLSTLHHEINNPGVPFVDMSQYKMPG